MSYVGCLGGEKLHSASHVFNTYTTWQQTSLKSWCRLSHFKMHTNNVITYIHELTNTLSEKMGARRVLSLSCRENPQRFSIRPFKGSMDTMGNPIWFSKQDFRTIKRFFKFMDAVVILYGSDQGPGMVYVMVSKCKSIFNVLPS